MNGEEKSEELGRFSLTIAFTSGGIVVEMGEGETVEFKGDFGKQCAAGNEILNMVVAVKQVIQKNCRKLGS